MKAMIFAAGLGTRLYPITQTTPKALIKVKNIPLIEIVIRRLMMFGYNELIINIHHHADQIEQFLQSKNDFGIRIAFSDERDKLLDTGGGLKKASWFFDDGKPFLVHNVDVISDIDFGQLMESQIDSKALATLAVKTRPSSRYLLFDRQNRLCGWENTNTEEKIIVRQSAEIQPYAFSGIQVVDPDIFNYISQEGKFSIIDVYLKLAADHTIKSFEHNKSLWLDVGKVESLTKAGEIIDIIMK
jgi:NDP-sugar pyrophosphorylase family protein